MKRTITVEVDFKPWEEDQFDEEQWAVIQDRVCAALYLEFLKGESADELSIETITADGRDCTADMRMGLEDFAPEPSKEPVMVCPECGRTHCHCP